jgi:C4-dicarboxylate-specific signal transduction histidine kinase
VTKATAKAKTTTQEVSPAGAHAAKMASLGEMAGGVAHEINTPLGTLLLSCDSLENVLKSEKLDSAHALRIVALMAKTTRQIAKIVRAMRSLSRDGSKDPFEDTPIKDILENAMIVCAERCRQYDIDITVENTMGENATLQCRSSEISQVVVNLLSNAFDAIAKLPERWIRIHIREDGNFIELSITDSGKGIPAAVVAKIFDPFYTTKEVGKGTGLGLWISSGIVTNHDGTFEVDTACANTRFVIRFPKLQTKAALELIKS